MSLRSRVGVKSRNGLRRVNDVPLIRSEYSDEILYRNQREDRKLECACRYLDRASRVVSNELAQQKAAIIRSLARTKRIAETSTGVASAPPARRKASDETATDSANSNKRYLNGHVSRAEEVDETHSGGGAAVVHSNKKRTCEPCVYQAKGSSMSPDKTPLFADKPQTKGMDTDPRKVSYVVPSAPFRQRVRHNTD